MEKPRHRDDPVWRAEFGKLLKTIVITCNIEYRAFCEESFVTEATFRSWMRGDRLPHSSIVPALRLFLQDKLEKQNEKIEFIHDEICVFLSSHGMEDRFYSMRRAHASELDFVLDTLVFYRNMAKHDIIQTRFSGDEMPSSGKIKAVVFDFDGTLTKGKTSRTTWESLWISLGYDEKDCQELHYRFDQNEISHIQWCKITEEMFKVRGLHQRTVKQIACGIKLIKGVRKTFAQLRKQDIKVYIVSGSVLLVIQSVLGDLCQYVDRIQANVFTFDSDGLLTQIIGTKYDFEGKARFIKEIASELGISTRDILFVGNSSNDRFAYQSGAKTLCINPKLTDPSNTCVWNKCIQTCDNLEDILHYIDSEVWCV